MRIKFYILSVSAFLVFSLSSKSQSLPDWVMEMRKSEVNYPLLIQKFNEYWKDKLKEVEVEDQSTFEKESEFPIKEEYGWLRFYNHQYFEMTGLHMQIPPSFHSEARNRSSRSINPSGQWKVVGPVNPPGDIFNSWSGIPYGVGRVNQIAFSATHANVMYALAPAGLFISVDTGNTWRSTGTDFMGYRSFRSIAVDPANDSIIYIGTGDLINYSGRVNETGVIKSVDFGNTFTSLPNGMDSVVINVIQINPLNTDHIVAGGVNGIWKTSNAGLNWQHTYSMIDSFNMGHQIYDIKFKPYSSDTLYATTDTMFLISTDGGNSWSQGFNDFQFVSAFSNELLLGVTAAARDYIYIGTQQDFGNVYKSTDGGASFVATKKYATPGLIGYDTLLGSYGQGSYDFAFNADPFDSLKIYMGSISAYSSNDGGLTWPIPYLQWYSTASAFKLHPDQHQIIRNPLVPELLWVTNDGGIYAKHDTGSVFIPKQGNLPITQAFHFDADNFFDSTFAIGTQDNGSSYTSNGNDFNGLQGGDAYARIYCAYNNNAAIYTDNVNFGGGPISIDIRNPPLSYPINLPEAAIQEPMSLTPVTPLTAFVANIHVWETNNMNGNPVNWRKIIDNTSVNNFSAVNHNLADSSIFYAIRSDGYFFRTFNVLDNQPVFDSVLLPFPVPYVPSIATVPNDASLVYVCGGAELYMSVDNGLTWTNTTGTLPRANFSEIVADPFANDGSMYLLATNKVYYKNDTTNWIDYSNQLPNVTLINDIAIKKYNSQDRKVWVSIYGRSIWQSPVYESLVTHSEETNVDPNSIQVYPIPAAGIINVSCNKENLKINNIIIYNDRGQEVSITRKGLQKTRLNLNVSLFSNGIYFMEINTTQGILMKKIVVHN